MKPKYGHVKYSGRAFHQDATEAMGGDIVRALIETITNSDDAYGDKTGKIRIEIEHRRGGSWKVINRDRATGMSTQRMEEVITSLGSRTSGFELGADVRGNLGRGSKDLAAFGQVVFESIFNEEYAHMTLNPDGDYVLDAPAKCKQQHRNALGIPRGNGTVVTIFVTENIRCPQHSKLIDKLSKHYQLRDIISDPKREICLVDLNNNQEDLLHYIYPNLPVETETDLVIEEYPEAKAKLILCRNSERYDDPASDPLRPAGILIKGRRAIYENTLFRFETNPFAGWFSGRIICPFIDTLASAYDEKFVAGKQKEASNPIPIITRRRDGLQKNHPFYKALAAQVEKYLEPLISAEEKKSKEQSSTESIQIRKMLDGLGKDLSKLMDEDLRELDEEGLLGSNPDGQDPPTIRIIPQDIVLFMGEEKTISVIVNPKKCSKDSNISIKTDPEGVIYITGENPIKLSQHQTRADLLSGQIHLRPLLEGQTLIMVTCNGYSDAAIVEVRPERIIEVASELPVDSLQFEHENYRIAWTRKKKIKILAPLDLIAKYGTCFKVSSSNRGIVIRKGNVDLCLDEELEQYFSEIVVEARELSSTGTLSAVLGDQKATCKVMVTKEEEGPSLSIRIVDEEAGNFRAIVATENNQTVIKVMGRHPIMKRYRGPAPSYPGDNLPITKLLLAEIVADQVSRIILEKKYPNSINIEQLDAARFYVEHYRYMSKYLPRCHNILLSDIQIEQLQSVIATV